MASTGGTVWLDISCFLDVVEDYQAVLVLAKVVVQLGFWPSSTKDAAQLLKCMYC